MEDQKLNYQQTAELTGINLSTLYTLVFQKRIPHIRLGKRLVRFSKQEIYAWIESNKVSPEPQK